MEDFFQVQTLQTNNGEILWFENEAFLMNQSAFLSFRDQSTEGFGVSGYGNVSANHRNMKKKMMEFLKKSWSPKIGEVKMGREKVHKHMIKERIRREKQKQSYLDLHKVLPMGTKGEKNAIVQTAASRIQELQKYKQEFSSILEIETKIGAPEVEKTVQSTLFETESNFLAHQLPMTW